MAKKKFNLTKFMVYFIAFIMVSSIFGIMFSGYNQTSSTLTYNGHKFTRENNYWSTKVGGNKVTFDYFPEEVDYINISSDIMDKCQSKTFGRIS